MDDPVAVVLVPGDFVDLGIGTDVRQLVPVVEVCLGSGATGELHCASVGRSKTPSCVRFRSLPQIESGPTAMPSLGQRT